VGAGVVHQEGSAVQKLYCSFCTAATSVWDNLHCGTRGVWLVHGIHYRHTSYTL
jgi:hypothetical protein